MRAFGGQLEASQRLPRQYGQPGCGEQSLGHVLVHLYRRTQYARADVGDFGQFEQTLQCAVFAATPVNDGKEDIERQAFWQRVRRVRLDPRQQTRLARLRR